MARKLYLEGDFFDGYSLVGIVCGLPDFRATHFINKYCHLELKKYKDFSLREDNDSRFSWYCFRHEELRRDYYLIQNKNGQDILLPPLRNFDYFLLLYGHITEQYMRELLASLRKTPYVTAVFPQDLNALKNGALLIEKNELHAVGLFTQ